jgi:hypothetical protein
MTNGMILLLMTALFLIFGYMGVPVAFALMAGVKSCWRCRSSCWSVN